MELSRRDFIKLSGASAGGLMLPASFAAKVAAGEVPPPTTVRGDYPPELEAIVMRALQADREQRGKLAANIGP